MATWHITVHSDSQFQLQGRMRFLRNCFAAAGFTVQTMPEHRSNTLSVSHTANSAMSLFLLKVSNVAVDLVQIS